MIDGTTLHMKKIKIKVKIKMSMKAGEGRGWGHCGPLGLILESELVVEIETRDGGMRRTKRNEGR